MKRRFTSKKKGFVPVVLVLSLLLLLCAGAAIFAILNAKDGRVPIASTAKEVPPVTQNSVAGTNAASTQEQTEKPDTVVSFSAVGDNLVHNGIYLQAQARAGGSGYDFSYVFQNVAYFFEPFDINWMDQETILNNKFPPSNYPLFSTPAEMGNAAYNAGWNVFSLSNNHIYDLGADGISATQEFWSTMPEDTIVTGLFTSHEPENGIVYQDIKGLKIAYLSYTEHTNGFPTPANAPAFVIYTHEPEVIRQQVEYAKEHADVVVVGLHWGAEDSHLVSEDQRALAQQIASWGATIIVGTHPHVIRPVEWIETSDGRQVLVAYSLGNFLSAQAYSQNLVGLALTLDFVAKQAENGEFTSVTVENVKIFPTVTHYDTGYGNIRNYMFRDYTQELASQHGVLQRSPSFSIEYIQKLTQQYISEEFLILD